MRVEIALQLVDFAADALDVRGGRVGGIGQAARARRRRVRAHRFRAAFVLAISSMACAAEQAAGGLGGAGDATARTGLRRARQPAAFSSSSLRSLRARAQTAEALARLEPPVLSFRRRPPDPVYHAAYWTTATESLPQISRTRSTSSLSARTALDASSVASRAVVLHQFERHAAAARDGSKTARCRRSSAPVSTALRSSAHAQQARRPVGHLVEQARIGNDHARAHVFHRDAAFHQQRRGGLQNRLELLERLRETPALRSRRCGPAK